MTFVGTGLPGPYSQSWSGYVDVVDTPLFSLGDAIQVDGSPVDLSYIDFVKVQTSLNVWAGIFGEISTELTNLPEDAGGPPDPAKLLTCLDAGGGQYSYRFVNNSGYDLNVTLNINIEFTLMAGADLTKTAGVGQAYFDFYGGNINFVRETGKVTFSDGPSEGDGQ